MCLHLRGSSNPIGFFYLNVEMVQTVVYKTTININTLQTQLNVVQNSQLHISACNKVTIRLHIRTRKIKLRTVIMQRFLSFIFVIQICSVIMAFLKAETGGCLF